jgi:chromosome partitioning protein
MRKIIFANRKGGSGKTTVAVNLACRLAQKKRRVLVIDLDSQSHSTFYLGSVPDDVPRTLQHLLDGAATLPELVATTSRERLALLPSTRHIAELNDRVGDRVTFLRDALPADLPYDYVLIDLPPSLEKIVLCGLIAADEVFIPLQTHFFPMQGLAQLVQLVYDVNRRWNPELRVTGIIPTLYNERTRIHRRVIDEVSKTFGRAMLLPGIPFDIRLAEAPSFRESIFAYAPRSNAARAFDALTARVLKMEA